MQTIIELINNYGYIILFSALLLELIAFPLPGETIMTYCGFLVYQGRLNLFYSILVATTGVILGITLSYFAGFILGENFFKKYGPYMHLTHKRLKKVSTWFDYYGTKLIFIAYFIPGIRHITGYFSGITKISYKKFAFTAYSGAFLWTSTFILLGRFLGHNWNTLHKYSIKFSIIGILVIAVTLILIYIYRKLKISQREIPIRIFLSYNSIGRITIIVASIAIILLGFWAYSNIF